MSSGAEASVEDALGRRLEDLRLSVTDRCNFRCRYCMPREQFQEQTYLARGELLSFEEVRRVAGLFVRLGVSKIRLTGGEPLLRRDLPLLVRALSELNIDLALTTNGVLLGRLADSLYQAGLGRVTVSLDALDEGTFQRMCDAPSTSVGAVLEGIAAAERAGFAPPKINCVVRRGENDDQILPLATHFWGRGNVLRFIEYMDVGESNGWKQSDVLFGQQVIERLSALGSVEALPRRRASDVANSYLIGGRLEVGVITSVSQPFCGGCSRMRLSADGALYTCLFSGQGHGLKERLRRGDDDDALLAFVRRVWEGRSDRYSEERGQAAVEPQKRLPVLPRVEMSYIGG